jgi:hypothetical protein
VIRVLTLLLSLVVACQAQERIDIPHWVLAGILRVETGSFYRADGSIRYVNKERGRAGERGCFQVREIAFKQVRHKGEQFWQIEQDTAFCEEIAWRYLTWLYQNSAKGSWHKAVEKYNAGPRGRNRRYLDDVIEAARQDGYTVE